MSVRTNGQSIHVRTMITSVFPVRANGQSIHVCAKHALTVPAPTDHSQQLANDAMVATFVLYGSRVLLRLQPQNRQENTKIYP